MGQERPNARKTDFQVKGLAFSVTKRLDEVRLKPRPLIVTDPILSLVSDRSALKTFFMDVI